ncbi:MAG: hypothetical protein QOK48_3713 [Blastocatellia bacterium]|jgi:hypothetical protein|nr:hypothetical protein [Blastocatellia bacterium]
MFKVDLNAENAEVFRKGTQRNAFLSVPLRKTSASSAFNESVLGLNSELLTQSLKGRAKISRRFATKHGHTNRALYHGSLIVSM